MGPTCPNPAWHRGFWRKFLRRCFRTWDRRAGPRIRRAEIMRPTGITPTKMRINARSTTVARSWQSAVQGRPSFKAGDAAGDYLWHDSTSFHLRVTHPGHQREVFNGEITSSTAMSITPYRLEKGDVVRMSADHRTMVFVLSDYGYVDGVNFHTDCAAALTVSHLNMGNTVLPTANVYLGGHKAHPSHIPFTVHRHPTA